MSAMVKAKSRKSSMSSGLQSNISMFFSSKMSQKSPRRGTTMCSTANAEVSDEVENLDREITSLLLSPFAIPETPESETRAPATEGPRSPVSRSPRSRSLNCKTNLMASRSSLPQEKRSPKSGDTLEEKNGISRFVSVKRLMGSESLQKTKRPRVRQFQRDFEKESSSPGEDLDTFLQIIRDSPDFQNGTPQKGDSKNTERKSGKVKRILSEKNSEFSTLSEMKMGKLTSEKVYGATVSKHSKDNHLKKHGSNENEKENKFVLVTAPKTNMAEMPSDNQSDLVLSYSSWICDNKKQKSVLSCPVNENKSLKECSEVLAAQEKDLTNSEENFTDLEDSWFDDKMEQSLGELKLQKSNSEKKIPEHVILAAGHKNRYWVLEVQETSGCGNYAEKHLTITCSKTMQHTETCVLKDGWATTAVAVGDIIHLEGERVSGSWVIDNDSGYLVLLPDLLISGTSIANSIRCMRRAVLGEMFKTFDGGSKQMLNGSVVHDVFQKAAMSLDFSLGKLEELASEVLLSPNYLRQMYSLKLTQADMKQEVEEYLPALAEWAKDYLYTSPEAGHKQLPLKLPSDGAPSRNESLSTVIVTDFVDIEENIWCPRFGLKGKLDVTAGVRIQRRGRPCLDRVVPLELKTGKESNSIEHRSQVILYTLMSADRRADAEAGFLIYLKTGSLHPVVANHMDKRELLKLRNTLAQHVGRSLTRVEGRSRMAPIPGIISDQQACKFCPQRRNCALYNRAVEGVLGACPPEAPEGFLRPESEHLRQPHLRYFSHWLLLCSLETLTVESKSSRRGVWLCSAQEREKSGSCMGNLVLAERAAVLTDDVYSHRFQRGQGDHAPVGLLVGDRVVVSDQDSRFIGLATGYVTAVTNTTVTCSLDKNLSKYSLDMVFRLDQDEGAGGLTTHLGNLSMLMENTPTSERLRQLIVEYEPPRFIESLSSVLPRNAKDTVATILKGLNKPQKQAMKKVLLSRDYTLIVGMPGTGKTTTICTLVRILHACGFSVLLTSYTHSAVDNILLKLRKFKIGFLRLGRAHKVHRDVLPFTEEHARARGVRTLQQLEDFYNKELVVATTCMGAKHPIFSRRRFDFCIVDEASQISQPVCLGPLFYAQRFVLVGDHQQLPPIVQNPEARALGMDESLFKRLEHHREAVVQLTVQYRMNSAIMSLSNALMYEGRLECGSERTACAVLDLPCRAAVERELELYVCQPQYSAWVHTALDPQKPVCFLDTSQVPALETVEKGGVSNHMEAALVHTIVSLLIKAGCSAGDIGVIAPYRQQLKAISTLLDVEAFRAVEVNTVDRYQGRDKSVVIVSFVRSHTDGNLGELLKDWRRLNVAITRAKHKLLMIGSAPTLRLYAPLEKLLAHMQQENMVFQLPPAAPEALPRLYLG
ncbi:DNA replication ATP-dependent helicase/nuclease DNA2 [Electrophorus electricus]|uniref:DNA replication ATP-dependent helicase/nuclease DNA2 n=1 Tax=Electrophorus electricus TaxID=8005 RepID=UPI0015CFE443|nr:DNA replication ATP-dependent helicase/nuclease DNA2 [Electrophorus electricus]